MKDSIHSITKVILIVLLALSVVSGLAFYGLFDFNRTLDMMMGDLNNPYMNEIFTGRLYCWVLLCSSQYSHLFITLSSIPNPGKPYF